MVEILQRNRFVAIPGAAARRGPANTWEVTIPRTPEVARALRLREVALEAFDGATFAIDGVESMQAIGAGETAEVITVTVLM